MKVNLISLGCAKNLVDSEYLLGLLNKEKFKFVKDWEEADIVILNTCSFISSARKEAKQYISKLSDLKKKKRFIFLVIGCLAQLEKENVLDNYPQVDAIFGISDYHKIPKLLLKLRGIQTTDNIFCNKVEQKVIEVSTQENFVPSCKIPRILSTPKSYAYLKIADGCDNRCSYCLIPTIRGAYRERRIEDIIEEAKRIVDTGVKELILVSNDTTFYGYQIYKKQMLHKLLKELSKIKELFWIRILYTHPGHFYEELIEEIATNDKICKYLDIPIQHTSDKILSLMGRQTSRKQIFSLIEKLRKKIKDITLRTTLIVGFPDEQKSDFKILLEDIKQLEFDWLGSFMFSAQKGTKAYDINPKADQKTKKQRFAEIMKLQQKITYTKNKRHIGKTYTVLVDNEKFGHTEFQCPEEDGITYFLNFPKYIKETIKIYNANIYDIYGNIV